MEQTALLSSLFQDEIEAKALQNVLDRLSQGKIAWEEIKDPYPLSRLAATGNLRTLLHLATFDNRLDIIDLLKDDLLLKSRRDHVGLSPVDVAKLLGHREALQLLEPNEENLSFPKLPVSSFFTHLSHPVFEMKLGLEDVIATIAKAKAEDKVPSEKIWLGIYFDKEIRKGAHAPIEIRRIDDEVGFGVFAMRKISPCAFVGEYAGIIQQKKPSELKEKNYALRYTIWEGKKNYCIDAEHCGNFTRFINHSFTPNLGLQSIYWRGIPRMVFIALREIKEGEQLTFDYGPIFWKQTDQIPKEFPP